MDMSDRVVVAGALVWLSESRVLLQRRPWTNKHGAGALEFPGGKVELGESPRAALERELIEEWGPAAAQLRIGPVADVLHHVYPPPAPEVILCVYHVDGSPWHERWPELIQLVEGHVAEAFSLADLPVASFIAADRDLAEALRRGAVARRLP